MTVQGHNGQRGFRRRREGTPNQNGLQGRQLILDIQHPLKIPRLAHHQAGAGVLDLVAQELTNQGRVQRHADGGYLVGGDPGGDRVDIVVEHRDDRRAGDQAKVLKGMGEPVAGLVKLDVGVSLSAEIQKDLVWMSRNGPAQRSDRRVARAGAPSRFSHIGNRIHSFILGAGGANQRQGDARHRQYPGSHSVPGGPAVLPVSRPENRAESEATQTDTASPQTKRTARPGPAVFSF